MSLVSFNLLVSFSLNFSQKMQSDLNPFLKIQHFKPSHFPYFYHYIYEPINIFCRVPMFDLGMVIEEVERLEKLEIICVCLLEVLYFVMWESYKGN